MGKNKKNIDTYLLLEYSNFQDYCFILLSSGRIVPSKRQDYLGYNMTWKWKEFTISILCANGKCQQHHNQMKFSNKYQHHGRSSDW